MRVLLAAGPPWWVPVLGVPLVGGLLAVLVRFFLDRRSERAKARGPARLVQGDLETAVERLQDCLDTDYWTAREPLSLPNWEAEKATLAGVMTNDELTVMRAAARWVDAANGANRRRSRLNDEGRELVFLALHAAELGRRSIDPLAKGRGGIFRARRVPEVVGPDPSVVCTCGHRFCDHELRIQRRRLRTTRLRASHVEVAGECGACICGGFFARTGEPATAAWARRARLAGQASYEPQTTDFVEPPGES